MKAAQLQDNKKMAKDFMQRLDIPTARWKAFTNPHKACSFITYADFPALVVKAVTSSERDFYITRDKDEACRAVQRLTQDWILGASTALVVEERLEGKEYICLCVTDGVSLAPLPFVHISKQCVSEPASPDIIQMSEKNSKKIQDNILQKAIDAMRQEGWHYKGLFGAKIMMTGKGSIVLGFICTFQDLKSQMIVPLLKPDLYEVIQAAIGERLSSYTVMWCLEKCVGNTATTTREIWSFVAKDKQPDPDEGHRNAKMASDEIVPGGATAATPIVGTKCNEIVAFPGMAFRKDDLSAPQKGKERQKLLCSDETHTTNDPTSDVAEPGPRVMKNVHQSLKRKVRYFDINTAQYKDPVFVCSSSSIGDKIEVALACNLHRSAAQSLVTTCINDLLAQGAQTLFFMPHCVCGQLPAEVSEALEDGLARGCRRTGATLLDSPRVQIRHFLEALKLNNFQLLKNVILYKAPAKISKVAVLISPEGPKVKLIMNTIRQLGGCARLSLIVSNNSAVEELKKAAGAGIPTRVLHHTMFGCRSEFESTVCRVLEEFSIDLICLAGFGRTLSDQFLIGWRGKIVKLFPSLLPSMKVEKSPVTGWRVHGCTVCFMLDGSSPGPIILQETAVADPEVPACAQMEEAEQRAVAKAVHLVASGSVALGMDGCTLWKSGD